MSFEKIGQAYVSGRAPVIHAGIQKQQKQSKKKNAYTKFPNYLPRYFDDLDVNCGTLLLYLFYLFIDS